MRVTQLKALHSICLVVIAISEEYASLARNNLLLMCESSLLSSIIQDPKYTKLLTSSVLCPTSEWDIIAFVLLILIGSPVSTVAPLSFCYTSIIVLAFLLRREVWTEYLITWAVWCSRIPLNIHDDIFRSQVKYNWGQPIILFKALPYFNLFSQLSL